MTASKAAPPSSGPATRSSSCPTGSTAIPSWPSRRSDRPTWVAGGPRRRRASTSRSGVVRPARPPSSARAGSGPLHIGICAEYDALPGIGHACGHNVICAAAVGAGLALARVADDLGIDRVGLRHAGRGGRRRQDPDARAGRLRRRPRRHDGAPLADRAVGRCRAWPSPISMSTTTARRPTPRPTRSRASTRPTPSPSPRPPSACCASTSGRATGSTAS